MKRAARGRWTLLVGSTVVSLAVAFAIWRVVESRRSHDTVLVIDNSGAVIRELQSRAVEPDPSGGSLDAGSYPPPFLREPLDAAKARIFFPFVKPDDFDPYLYYGHEKNLDVDVKFKEHPAGSYHIHINADGFRNAAEVRSVRPDLRVLVTGDSHTDGVCSNDETFSHRLEVALSKPDRSVEVLNGACFGYALYQYLAVLEHHADLEPHLFVPTVYGGNDFYSIMSLQRYFHRRAPPNISRPSMQERISEADLEERGVIAQELGQAQYFKDNPEDVEISIATAATISLEIARVCREKGIALLFVYLPPPYRGQPEMNQADAEPFLRAADLDEEAVRVSDRIADRWLAFLAERGIAALDLREAIRADTRRLYYLADHHLNPSGHEVVATALHPIIEELVDEP